MARLTMVCLAPVSRVWCPSTVPDVAALWRYFFEVWQGFWLGEVAARADAKMGRRNAPSWRASASQDVSWHRRSFQPGSHHRAARHKSGALARHLECLSATKVVSPGTPFPLHHAAASPFPQGEAALFLRGAGNGASAWGASGTTSRRPEESHFGRTLKQIFGATSPVK